MRHLALLVAIAPALAAPAAQETQEIPPLERIVGRNIILRPADNHCLVPSLVRSIARDVGLPAGVEHLPGACDYRRPPNADPGSWVALIGMSVREALNTLTAFDPRYHWIESEGVILVRPLEAWGDEDHLLHQTIGKFSAEEEHAGILLNRLRARLTDVREREPWLMTPQTPDAARPLTFHLPATTAILALDAIVREHGSLTWVVEYCRPERRLEYVWMRVWTHDMGGAIERFSAIQRREDGSLFDPCAD
jgi:hypothetical protein